MLRSGVFKRWWGYMEGSALTSGLRHLSWEWLPDEKDELGPIGSPSQACSNTCACCSTCKHEGPGHILECPNLLNHEPNKHLWFINYPVCSISKRGLSPLLWTSQKRVTMWLSTRSCFLSKWHFLPVTPWFYPASGKCIWSSFKMHALAWFCR